MMGNAALIAELLGTFALVMSIFISGGSALVIGLTLAAIVFLVGNISGAHVNPAVSLAMYYSGSMTMKELISYIVVQLVGGISAALIYKL
jgi:aquaporin Z